MSVSDRYAHFFCLIFQPTLYTLHFSNLCAILALVLCESPSACWLYMAP